jgi:hypothetical protein
MIFLMDSFHKPSSLAGVMGNRLTTETNNSEGVALESLIQLFYSSDLNVSLAGGAVWRSGALIRGRNDFV